MPDQETGIFVFLQERILIFAEIAKVKACECQFYLLQQLLVLLTQISLNLRRSNLFPSNIERLVKYKRNNLPQMRDMNYSSDIGRKVFTMKICG